MLSLPQTADGIKQRLYTVLLSPCVTQIAIVSLVLWGGSARVPSREVGVGGSLGLAEYPVRELRGCIFSADYNLYESAPERYKLFAHGTKPR